MPANIEAGVRDYYGKTLKSSADLKTDACCSPSALPRKVREALSKVHDEVLARYYGCGLTIPSELSGLSVLDLGSGSGRDCYLLSQLVGAAGRVTGVDMTEEQLEVAERHRGHHAKSFGYGNVEFLKGPGHPLQREEERRYMVGSVRSVHQCLVSSGSGWMDAEPEIAHIQPTHYVVNEDGDQPDKREFCRAHGIEYVVLERIPHAGLPRRSSTDLRGF